MVSTAILRRFWPLFAFTFALVSASLFIYVRWNRHNAPLDDFGTVYGAARCWIHGQNPFQDAEVARAFHSAGGPAYVASGTSVRPSVYFLPAMPIFASIAWIGWNRIHAIWLVFCAACVVAAIFVVSRRLPFPPSGQLVSGCALALLSKPFATGFWFGNPSLPVMGAVIVSADMAIRKRPYAAGVLLGLALAVKPQLSGGLFLALLMCRQWRALVSAVSVVGAATTVAALRAGSLATLQLWLATQSRNLVLSLAPGHINDPRLGSVYGYQFLNIQTLVGVFTTNAAVGNLVAWGVCAALIALYLLARRHLAPPDLWTDFSFFTVILMLPAYHRNYDGEMLIILLPWMFGALLAGRWWTAGFGSVCLSLILAGSFTWTLDDVGSPSDNGSVFRALELRHQAFLVLSLGVLLALGAYRRSPMPVPLERRAAAA